MLAIERGDRRSNSLNYNPTADDKTYLGYMALAYCITVPEKLYLKNYHKIMGSLRGGSIGNNVTKKGINDKVIVVNINTEKKRTFSNYKQASEHTNVSVTTIHSAIRRGRVVKDTWLFTLKKAGGKGE